MHDDIEVFFFDRAGRQVHTRRIESQLAEQIGLFQKPIAFQWRDRSGKLRRFWIERDNSPLALKRGRITAREK